MFGIYAFGTGGIFFTDDAPSLDGMLTVRDGLDAATYVFGGTSGPLGRPLSLASFLLQRGSYPETAAPFLWVNILIHIANVLLLCWLVRRMQKQLPAMLGRSDWIALAVAFLWGVLPILASASLMVIQRMTTLSALLVLLGFHAYVWARTCAAEARRLATIFAIASIGFCTALAALSKENGVLLPLLLLVTHHVLYGNEHTTPDPSNTSLPTTAQKRSLQRLLTLCMWFPSAAVLGYMVSRLPSISGTYWNRPFELHERLASEAVILWEYLAVAFVPRLADLSPFRDDYPALHFSDSGVQLALIAWVAVLFAGAVLWRRGRPLLLFALLWYLAGHLLESGMFALFLYFEHRNYVPLMGPVLALVVSFTAWAAVPANVRGLVAGAYALFMAFMLWQTTSMWGGRQQLVWAQAHPDSPRALQMLAGAYMRAGKVKQVDELYEGAIQRNPKFTSVAMQGLRTSCYLNDGGDAARRWLAHARQSLPTGQHSHLTVASLDAIARMQAHGRCQMLSAVDVIALVELVQENPVFRGRSDQKALRVIRANVLLSGGDVQGAMVQMRLALEVTPDMDTIKTLHQLALKTKGQEAANDFLSSARAMRMPEGLFARLKWQRDLDLLGAS
ncbi:tetratricopeptide repeat protein [Ottowia caeni]|uniref:tetratricopeptide repeat protein n=1 Tax=Ottowia caeni TaxID=2870339 RepID=UPI003D71CF14